MDILLYPQAGTDLKLFAPSQADRKSADIFMIDGSLGFVDLLSGKIPQTSTSRFALQVAALGSAYIVEGDGGGRAVN